MYDMNFGSNRPLIGSKYALILCPRIVLVCEKDLDLQVATQPDPENIELCAVPV